jgi:hypothetical protein
LLKKKNPLEGNTNQYMLLLHQAQYLNINVTVLLEHFGLPRFGIFDKFCLKQGARGSVVVKALSYKPEGRGFDT